MMNMMNSKVVVPVAAPATAGGVHQPRDGLLHPCHYRPRLWLVGLIGYCLIHNFRSLSLDHQGWLKSSNTDKVMVSGSVASLSKSHLTTNNVTNKTMTLTSVREPSTPTSSSFSTTTSTTNTTTTVAACLLVMDDNHLLVEWLAYHYHVVHLRTLIVATDPKSETSPSSILNRWKKKRRHGDHHYDDDDDEPNDNNTHHRIDMDMTIIEWKEDRDYMTEDEFAVAQKETRQFYNPQNNKKGRKNEKKATVTNKNDDGDDNDDYDTLSPELTKHRARQRLFYKKCLQTLKTMHHQDYVLLLDTDEFLNLNVDRYRNSANRAATAVSLESPGTVINLLDNEIRPDDDSLLLRRPLVHAPLQASPCLQVPRSRFAAQESSREQVLRGTPSQLWTTRGSITTHTSSPELEAHDLTTLRYRWHAQPWDRKQNRLSKVILHLGRIPTDMLFHRTFMTSIHAPLEAPWCTKQGLHLTVDESVLVIHHYLGSYEQYVYRGTKDARAAVPQKMKNATTANLPKGQPTVTSAATLFAGSENARTPEQFDAIGRQMKRPLLASDSIRSWLHGFVDVTVRRRLRDSLHVEPTDEQVYHAARYLLQGVGHLESKTPPQDNGVSIATAK